MGEVDKWERNVRSVRDTLRAGGGENMSPETSVSGRHGSLDAVTFVRKEAWDKWRHCG